VKGREGKGREVMRREDKPAVCAPSFEILY